MAETLERLEVEIDADISELKQGLNKAKSQFGSFSNDIKGSSSGITSALGGIGKAAVGAFAVKEIEEFGKECVDLASDLQEVQNVVVVTFGGMSGQIDAFADNAEDRFGLAEKSTKQYTGTMGAMLKSSGLATEAALEMSTNMTALAGDLASFYNLSTDEAFTKIRAGISGETEPLKQLGINMSVANMEAYALSEGITKSYDSMTQAEQTILRYNYLIATTSAQQDDFARTSESWANQTKTTKMQFDELKASMGEGLIELFTPALGVINEVIKGIQWITNGIKGLLGFGGDDTSVNISTTDADVSDVSADLGNAATNAQGVADGLNNATKAASALKRTVSGFDEANVLSDSASGLADTGALKGITDSMGSMKDAIKSAYDGLTDMNDKAGDVNTAFGNISLNASQIDGTVKMLTAEDGSLAKMAEMSKNVDNMKSLADNINTAKKTIEGYNWMVSMGVELSKEDEATYKKAVDDYCANVQKYVQEQQKAVGIAIELVYGTNSQEYEEMNGFYNRIQGQLASLSQQIKEKVNSAWEDGVLELDEAQEIQNLMDQQQRIINAMNEAEFTVKFNKIKVDASGADLDRESFLELEKQAKEQLEQYRKGTDEAITQYEIYLQTRVNLGEIDQAQMDKELEQYKKDAEIELSKHQVGFIQFEVQAAINLVNNDYDFSALKISLENGMKEAFSQEELDQILASGFEGENMWKSTMSALFTSLSNGISSAGMNEESKQAVKHILDQLKPQEKEWKELAQQYKEKGETVPEYISNGLSSINLLKAMTGDVDAIYWLMGNQMKGTEYANTIKKAKESGLDVPESLLSGLNDPTAKINLENGVDNAILNLSNKIETSNEPYKAGKTSGEKTYKGYLAGVGTQNQNDAAAFAEARGKATAEAYGKKSNIDAAKKSGTNTGNAFNKGVGDVNTASIAQKKGEDAAKAIASGSTTLNSKANQTKLTVASNAYWGLVSSTAIKTLDIKGGKSGVFMNYGDYTVKGYNDALNSKSNKTNSQSAISMWVSNITTWFKNMLGIHSPSDVFEGFADNTSLGFNNQILANIPDSKKAMQRWGSDISHWGNDYLSNDFGNVASASINGNLTTDITGSIANAVKTAMDSQKNTFYAVVDINGEKHVQKFVKTYNKMHGGNPDFGFAL